MFLRSNIQTQKNTSVRYARFLLSVLVGLSLAAVQTNFVFAGNPIGAIAAINQPAPEFMLKDADGKAISLKDFRNKIVVLEWFDDMCPFVKKHYRSGNMQSLQKEFGKKGVVWIVINSSGLDKPGFHTASDSKELMKGWKFSSPYFLQDPSGTVGHAYGAKTTPNMYVIGKNGLLLYSGAIDDQPDTDVESIRGARNYVREALDQALAGKPVTTTVTKPYG